MPQVDYKQICTAESELLTAADGPKIVFETYLKKLSPTLLVAFANMPTGGTIMVTNTKSSTDNDSTESYIDGMAACCLPPLVLSIQEKKVDGNCCFQVEVPASEDRPYCTEDGEYVVWSEGKIRTLPPHELQALFLKQESKAQVSPLKGAQEESGTEQILEVISSVEKNVYEGNVDTDKSFEKLCTVLDSILDKLEIEDPYINEKKEHIQSQGTVLLMEDLPHEEIISGFKKQYPFLDEELIQQWLSETEDLFNSNN